jgi:hypothetical protein
MLRRGFNLFPLSNDRIDEALQLILRRHWIHARELQALAVAHSRVPNDSESLIE